MNINNVINMEMIKERGLELIQAGLKVKCIKCGTSWRVSDNNMNSMQFVCKPCSIADMLVSVRKTYSHLLKASSNRV